MNKKQTLSYRNISLLLVAALAAAALGFWWLSTFLPEHGWAVRVGHTTKGENWLIEAVGWQLVVWLWPVALAGGLVGFLVSFSAAVFLCQRAVADELGEQKKQLAREKETLIQRFFERERTLQISQEEVHQQLESLDAKHQAVALAREQVKGEIAKARTEVINAQIEVAAMQIELEQAQLRTRNAICAAERIKRRVEGKARLWAKPSSEQ